MAAKDTTSIGKVESRGASPSDRTLKPTSYAQNSKGLCSVSQGAKVHDTTAGIGITFDHVSEYYLSTE